MESRSKISYERDFGLVLRSAATFYFKKTSSFKTTVSMLNYWKLKRNIDVTIVASLRKMDGSLIKREQLNFDQGEVINYSPEVDESDFEGSIEIEVFALSNLVIPFAGINVIYQSKDGISMVHNYCRTYSNYEIEEHKTITNVEETCVPIWDTEEIESMVVSHNGFLTCGEQTGKISVLNHESKRLETEFPISVLTPYETLKIRFQDFLPNLIEFLNGKPGYASVSFKLTSSFTRMLVINKKTDDSDCQVTHSDFNYSKHFTNKIDDDQFAYMSTPILNRTKQIVVVYPDCDPGNYELTSESGVKAEFNENKAANITLNENDSSIFAFKKINGSTPQRIHSAIRISKSDERIPSEACLGVYHHMAPEKHMFWGLCSNNNQITSRIIFPSDKRLSDDENNQIVTLRIFSAAHHNYQEIKISPSQLRKGMYLSELFPNSQEFLGTEFGWYTLYSPTTRDLMFSTLENQSDSITFEHSN